MRLVGFSTILLAVLLAAALPGCGGDGVAPAGQGLFDEWNGEYMMVFLYEEHGNIEVERYNAVADGRGSAIIEQTFNVTYTIDQDRGFVMDPGPGYESTRGRISANGDLLVGADAVYNLAGGTDRDVEFTIVVRKSSGLTMAALAGEYHVCQAGRNANGFYTSRVEVVVNPNGSGTWEILAHSQGIAGNGALTVTLNSSDGTITVNDGSGDDFGIMSPDGNMFVLSDGDDADQDGEVYLIVGVKKDTGAGTPNMTGTMMLSQMAQTDTMSTFRCYASRVRLDIVATSLNYTIIEHSEGDTGTGGPVPYTVTGDGWFTMPDNSGLQGHVSRDGNLLAVADTNMSTEDEIVFAVGLR